MKNRLKYFAALGSVCAFLASCASEKGVSGSTQRLGHYVASYDAESGTVGYRRVGSSDVSSSGRLSAQDYYDSAGVLGCAIIDNTKSPGAQDYCLGLVDPDNCTTEYNSTTHSLSFYARLRNRSNIANDGVNGSGYDYTDLVNYPPNTTFFAPFYFKIWKLDWSPSGSSLITSVNTNLPNTCGGTNGLLLSANDTGGNNRFDCIEPDEAWTATDSNDPGWDFSPFVTSGDMTPGEDTGCVLFMQFVLTQNASFTIGFDVWGTQSDGTPPTTPTVASPTDGSFVNTSTITVSGNNCTPTTGTVYASGGSDASPPSAACTGGGTFSISGVGLNLNAENVLTVYQVVGSEQSGSAVLTVTHDNVAPTLASWAPTNGETNVDRNVNCVATFSEAMKASTFSTGTTCANGTYRMCRGGTFLAGAIMLSTDQTQAVYTPTTKPLNASASHNCAVTTGLTDLAGNALTSSNLTSTFTTAANTAYYNDTTPPVILAMIPGDNWRVDPSTTPFTIYFNEAMNPSTMFNVSTGVPIVDAACSTTIPNVAAWELASCTASSAIPITGTMSLSADGTIATFTPNVTVPASSCFGFAVSSCVKDLAGNGLPSRGSIGVGAYGGATITYNTEAVFYTNAAGSDTTGPKYVFVGPPLGATSIEQSIFPFVVFDEPINPSTITSDYFYMTKFGSTTKLGLTLKSDPSLQRIRFQPSSVLNTTSTATHLVSATGAVADFSGNLMGAPQTSQFDVTSTADTTAPTVVRVTPTNGSTVSKCSVVDIDFSEPMDVTTLTSSNIQLIRTSDSSSKPGSIVISDNGMHVRFIPDSSLLSGGGAGDRTWRPTIGTGVKDRAGNALAAIYNSTSFVSTTDTTAPTVSSVVLPGGAANVPQNANLLINFSEPMDRSTITGTNLTLTNCNGSSRVVFASDDGRYAVFNCANLLTPGAKTLSVTTGVRDYYNATNSASCEAASGNAMAANNNTALTVVASSDNTAPTVSSVSPADNAGSVAVGSAPTITFSEAIDPRTLTDATVFLMDELGALVNSTLTLSSTALTVTVTPASNLTAARRYYLVATTALRDLGGGNAYDGLGGENATLPNVDDVGILKTCFATTGASCP